MSSGNIAKIKRRAGFEAKTGLEDLAKEGDGGEGVYDNSGFGDDDGVEEAGGKEEGGREEAGEKWKGEYLPWGDSLVSDQKQWCY